MRTKNWDSKFESTKYGPYAVSEENSKGRLYPEEPSSDRNDFQIDYSRILYSSSFRRLGFKTQVISPKEKGYFRTRAPHSLEVAQVAKTACEPLRLNGDLASTLAIAHDLGHPPFGHFGQGILNDLMKEHGGFEHNIYALKIVDSIESPYIEFKGLNLMFETREGILKRCPKDKILLLGDVAERHINNLSPTLEAQLVDLSDSISYLHADLEDAFFHGILKGNQAFELKCFRENWNQLKEKYKYLDFPEPSEKLAIGSPEERINQKRMFQTVIRKMLSKMVKDMIFNSKKNIELADLSSLDDVRNSNTIIKLSDEFWGIRKEIKDFSKEFIYYNDLIMNNRKQEEKMLRTIFSCYVEDHKEMSGISWDKKKDIHFYVCDHVARMTDVFVYSEFERLTMERPDLIRKVVKKEKIYDR